VRPAAGPRCRITLMLMESSLVGSSRTASSTFLPRSATPLIARIRSPTRNAPVLHTEMWPTATQVAWSVCLSVCLSHGLLDVPAPQRHTVDCQYAVSHSECAHPTSQSTRPIATDAAWSVCLSLYVLSGPSTPGNKITSGSTNGEMALSRVINDHVAE